MRVNLPVAHSAVSVLSKPRTVASSSSEKKCAGFPGSILGTESAEKQPKTKRVGVRVSS